MPETNLTALDILRAACGKDDSNQPKSILSFNIGDFDDNENEVVDVSSITFEHCSVDIKNHSDLIQTDIIFPSQNDIEMRRLWALFESYGDKLDKFENSEIDKSPVAIISLLPKKFNGKYIININEPIMWVMQPEYPGSQENNVIRFFVYNDDVNVSETEDFDLQEIQRYAEREAERETELQAQLEARKIEEEDYQAERNAAIEEMRKNGF